MAQSNPTVDSWNDAIADALEHRRIYGREDSWNKNEQFFYQVEPGQENNTAENLVTSVGDSLLSHLTVPNPFYLLQPLRMDCVDATPIMESVLNTLVYSLSMKEEVERATLHAFLYSRGIVKFGYDSEWGYDPEHDLGQPHGQIFGMSVSQHAANGSRIEYNQKVTPGMPWIEAVLPHDFCVPAGVLKLSKAPWAAHRTVRHIDDLRSDPKYERTRNLQPLLSMEDWVKSYTAPFKPYRSRAGTTLITGKGDQCYVELWEVHDARTGRVYTISPGYTEWLRNEIDYLQEDGLPFASLAFTPTSRAFWPTPPATYLINTQDEMIDVSTVQRQQRRISILKLLVEEGAMDTDELTKMLSGQIGVVAKYRQSTGSGSPIVAVTHQNNNQQLMMEAEELRKNARSTVGLGRNQAGEYEQKSRISATEVSTVQAGSDNRLDRRESALADFYCEIGKKLASLVVKFWKTPRVIQMVGDSGALEWLAFKGSDLTGEYQYKVGFSSEPVQSKASRQNAALQLYQFFAQDPTIDQMELRRFFARKFNDPEINRLFKPGVLANANLQLQMQQMQQGAGGVQPQQAAPNAPVLQASNGPGLQQLQGTP